jgi:hypothetical protein
MKDLIKENVNKRLMYNLTKVEDRIKLGNELADSDFFTHLNADEWPFILQQRAARYNITGPLPLSEILDKLSPSSDRYLEYKKHLINLGVL